MKKLTANIFTFVLLLTSSISYAQEVYNPANAPAPVEISAAGSLEWDKAQKKYTAYKNVEVKQDDLSIKCDSLSANYSNDKEMTSIDLLEAVGNVKISSPPYTAFGDKATYDVVNGKAVLTGKGITVTSGKDILTAEDRLEFLRDEKKIIAYGHPIVKHDLDSISANNMAAYFKKDETGKMISDKMIAKGNVVIKTQTENISGDNLIFNNQSRQAVMSGNVVIQKDKNYVRGHKAVVDMNTGISQLLSDDKSDNEEHARVKGVFYPKAKSN